MCVTRPSFVSAPPPPPLLPMMRTGLCFTTVEKARRWAFCLYRQRTVDALSHTVARGAQKSHACCPAPHPRAHQRDTIATVVRQAPTAAQEAYIPSHEEPPRATLEAGPVGVPVALARRPACNVESCSMMGGGRVGRNPRDGRTVHGHEQSIRMECAGWRQWRWGVCRSRCTRPPALSPTKTATRWCPGQGWA